MAKKILIIDDDKGDIKLIRELFKAQGFDQHILSAENGMESLALAQKEKPDIVLLDIRMPGLDGHAVCQELKSLGIKGMKVILMTGSLDSAAEAKIKKCKADGYCLKLPDSIFSAIAKFLQ